MYMCTEYMHIGVFSSNNRGQKREKRQSKGEGKLPSASHPDTCRSTTGKCYRLKHILAESGIQGQLATHYSVVANC